MGRYSGFVWSALALQCLVLVLFIWGTDYEDNAAVTEVGQPEDVARFYAMFQDVHLMIFIGFGFLMTFLRRYGYSGVGYNFFLAAFVMQWAILVNAFFPLLWHSDWGTADKFRASFPEFQLNVESLILGDYAAGAILISFGAVIGKLSLTQLLWMSFFEVIFYALNATLAIESFEVSDIGGSIVIHIFGAYFGLAVSLMTTPANIASDLRDKDNRSVYHSDLFAMIGTLFLWCFWPSFNGALASPEAASQHRVVINTVLALAASCLTSFGMSNLVREGRFDMVDIQNATLAGGVAVGACADLLEPWSAMLIGIVGGAVSVLGYTVVSDFLWKRIGLHDTAGVHNLHGMPGVIAGFGSALAAGLLGDELYGSSISNFFPARTEGGRTAGEQAGYQIAAVVTTIAIALASGALVGLLLRSSMFEQPKLLYTDSEAWETPDQEIPFYHANGEEESKRDV